MQNEQKGSVKIIDKSVIYANGLKTFLNTKKFNQIDIFIDEGLNKIKVLKENDLDYYEWVFFHIHNNEKQSSIENKIARLRRVYPKSKIIIYTSLFTDNILQQFFVNKINGIFLLDELPDIIFEIMDRITNKKIAISRGIIKEYLEIGNQESTKQITPSIQPILILSQTQESATL